MGVVQGVQESLDLEIGLVELVRNPQPKCEACRAADKAGRKAPRKCGPRRGWKRWGYSRGAPGVPEGTTGAKIRCRMAPTEQEARVSVQKRVAIGHGELGGECVCQLLE